MLQEFIVCIMIIGLNLLTLKHSEILALLQLFANKFIAK